MERDYIVLLDKDKENKVYLSIENKNELTLYHMGRAIEPCIMFHSLTISSMFRTPDKLLLRFPGSRLTPSPQCGTTPAFQLKCM